MAVPTLAGTAMECPEAAPLSAILGRIRKWSYVVIGCTGRGTAYATPPASGIIARRRGPTLPLHGHAGRVRERAAEGTMSRHPAELGYDAWRAVFDESGGCGAVVADPESMAGGTAKC